MYAYIKHAFVSPLLHVPVCVSFLALNFGTRLRVSHSSAISLANPLKRPPLLSPIMSRYNVTMSVPSPLHVCSMLGYIADNYRKTTIQLETS